VGAAPVITPGITPPAAAAAGLAAAAAAVVGADDVCCGCVQLQLAVLCSGCGIRAVLQIGHTASTLSHATMQSLWNMWRQLRWITVCPASYSQQQMAQQSATEQVNRQQST
jgi:hypothetical protein